MRLVRYTPAHNISRLNPFFDNFFAPSAITSRKADIWAPAVDILDNGDTVQLKAELPGMKKEEIAVNIEDRVLTISGEHQRETEEKNINYYRRERKTGAFKRSFALSDEIVAQEVTADYKDGILTVTLKKNTSKNEVKQITIH